MQFRTALLLWILPLWGFAVHIHWLGSYEQALQKAITEHKPLLVLVVKSDQRSNIVIQQELMNQPYIAAMNKHFVSVIVTYEGRENYPIEMYYTTVFPTLFFVDSSREVCLIKPLYGEEIRAERLAGIMKDLDIIQKNR